MTKLTRRELGILAGTTAVVGTVAPEAKAEPVPMFEVAQDVRWWTCRYCGEKNGGMTRGPWKVYRCKNPVCPDEWTNLTDMINDMVEHVEATGHQILSADIPHQLLVGFVAIDDMAEWHAKEWTIPITRACRRLSKADVETVRWLQMLGQSLCGPTDRAKFAAFLTEWGR